MGKGYLTQITVTCIEYAGDHDREYVVTAAASHDSNNPHKALDKAIEDARSMLQSALPKENFAAGEWGNPAPS